MNFQQLRIIREAARRDYNLTEVANALFTSQSGVSRHIRELEEELGVDIFLRAGKRLTGLTQPGADQDVFLTAGDTLALTQDWVVIQADAMPDAPRQLAHAEYLLRSLG